MGETHREKELFSDCCIKVTKELLDLLSSMMDKDGEIQTSEVLLVVKIFKISLKSMLPEMGLTEI